MLFNTNNNEGLRITSVGTVNIKGAGTAGSTQAVSFNGSAPVNSMVLDSSGRLGIGTSAPGSNLEVAGGTTSDGPGAELRLSSADQTIAVADEVIALITFKNNDVSSGMTGYMAKIDAASNRIFDGDPASGMNLRFFAGTKGDGINAPPERMRIKADGDVSIVTGNLIIGTAGKGIDFSADGNAAGMTSELLDDYEEGTWTPTCNAGATLTVSGSPQYTKIGRKVTVHAEFAVSSNVSGTQFQISGLPFASNNSTGNSAAVSMGYVATDLAAYLPNNATTITFQNLAASANKTNADLSGAYLIIACTYFTA